MAIMAAMPPTCRRRVRFVRHRDSRLMRLAMWFAPALEDRWFTVWTTIYHPGEVEVGALPEHKYVAWLGLHRAEVTAELAQVDRWWRWLGWLVG